MITLRTLGHLPVSAASGLVAREGELYVVADDETALYGTRGGGVFERRLTLVPDELPEDHDARKRAKPDFESLALLPDGRLLTLGSASEPSRARGVLVDLALDEARVFDFAPLVTALGEAIPDLNLEGATVHAGGLVLAQRGNGAAGVSALIFLDLARFLAGAEQGRVGPEALSGIVRVDLGTLEGVRLTPTDLASDGRSLYFAAAAEDSESTYLDGTVIGSALGVLALDGRVLQSVPVAPCTKLEGLTLSQGSRGFVCVSDPDDRSQKAPLFAAEGALVEGWLRG